MLPKSCIKLTIVAFFLIVGCSIPGTNYESGYPGSAGRGSTDDNLVSVGYLIAQHLIANLQKSVNRHQPILIASLVDVKHIEKSSNFGRMLAEYIGSRLALDGYTVMELKLRDSLFMKEEEGEFLLSRNVRNISKDQNAQAVVVGTYAWAVDQLYLSTRMVDPTNGKIISSFDYRLPLTYDLRGMLH